MNSSPNAHRGIVLAGGTGSRLHPLTLATSKQLMPVYDKPMIYYPISVLMLAGIQQILIISTPNDLPSFKRLLGSGEQFGVTFSYLEQPVPDGIASAFTIGERFLDSHPAALILGDNLFYGHDFTKSLQLAMQQTNSATIFAHQVSNPSDYGVIEFDSAGVAVSLEEKPLLPKSKFAVPGLYFYPGDVADQARQLKPSARGEREITTLNQLYLTQGRLNVIRLSRGTAWLDTGTHETLLEAAQFVQIVQNRQGLQIACLEEIGLKMGFLSLSEFENSISKMGNSTYAKYLALRAADYATRAV
jgi:glucose-1-phosphate thymidylyltransferase